MSLIFNFHLHDNGPEPLYQQLYAQLRNQIRSGMLPYGSRLPSVRALQAHFNISKTPIETAYQMLVAEGYAVSRPRSGLFVMNELQPLMPDESVFAEGAESCMSNLRSYAQTNPLRYAECKPLPPVQPSRIVDFRASRIDASAFPLRLWRRSVQEALEHHALELGSYGDPQGELAFRATIADYLRQSRGVQCGPDQIVIGNGIRYAASLLVKLLSDVDALACEDPGFAPFPDYFRRSGKRVIALPAQQIASQIRETDAGAVYVTPSHQFPTGSVLSYGDRERMLHWADSRGAYIIEDDYDGEFRYGGKPIPSLQSLDRSGRVIYIGTFSKAFSPALRMNYIVLPEELASRMRSERLPLDAPSRIDQWAMTRFIDQGYWFRHIRRIRGLYGKKHDRLLARIREYFGDHATVTGHSAGLHIQVSVRTSASSRELIRLAAEAKVAVYDFDNMLVGYESIGANDAPIIYLGFAALTEKQIDVGVRLLRDAWAAVLDE
ncbi:PLP-dependent aminotransferase family protein [Paenibacillus methanolicus]|uniref:GntR family transcriptional regulator/MocR family aminotransferase n=1 Tax=Paenibacillus methanolicus TaxID=582686 RepID=A0A5S5CIY7_9BACL|nr:PLP-dependent aminotransferase family protein [Paenibacillus methanolicus]TYP79749.1 GntR family transcriptional regulator/MocR family aminotransferase [Paenibacillus methanolicus]